MKSIISLSENKEITKELGDILALSGDSPLSVLYDDLVAIGTVPTPDLPKPSFIVKSKGSVAIDTVPLPEKRKRLKKILADLLKHSDETPIKKLFPH